jgi:hypothetical protein
LVDKHFCTLIEKGVDLKDYLESSLPITQIKDERFPSMHTDDSVGIFTANVETVFDLLPNYEKIVG